MKHFQNIMEFPQKDYISKILFYSFGGAEILIWLKYIFTLEQTIPYMTD